MLGIKQEALASELGDDWNQKKISLLEQKDVIEPGLLKEIAGVLKVPVDAIKNFDEEAAINYFNNFNDNKGVSQVIGNYGTYNFDPLDKLMDALEENKKLYERLLKEREEKIALLEKLLGHTHEG